MTEQTDTRPALSKAEIKAEALCRVRAVAYASSGKVAAELDDFYDTVNECELDVGLDDPDWSMPYVLAALMNVTVREQ